MKKIYDFGLAVILIGFCTFAASAQITCKDSITVALTQFDPMVEIFVDDIIIDGNTGDISLDRSQFDCDDVFEVVVVTASKGDSKCTTKVRVVDIYAPVAIAETNVKIEIPKGINTLLLNPQVLDDGSYDECSAVDFSLAPSIISCLDAGKILDVTMTVTDASGNSNFVITEVSVKEIDHAPVECVEDFEIAIVDQYFVSTKSIVYGDNECTSVDLQLINKEDGSPEDRTLTLDDVGKTIIAQITQLEDNSSCSTKITVVTLDCEPFIVCDTKCNITDFGDCDSGHTQDDNVEWPCDLLIDGEYPGMTVSPIDLINSFDVPEKDSEPQVVEGDCHVVGMTYQDQVSYIDNTVKVVREWFVLEWRTGYVASYVQEILFQSGGNTLVWNICDFEDNTTEIGDCSSGHTDSDDIEWPADVSAMDHRIRPVELINISNVERKNASPVILANEEHYNLSYEDAVISSAASFSVVARKWTLQSRQSSVLSVDFTQYITVPEVKDAEDKVFVTTHGGRPMPGVLLNGEFLTNGDGVVTTSSEDLLLEYSDDPKQGVDAFDRALMASYMLAQLSFYDIYKPLVMDVNHNGTVSAVDLLWTMQFSIGSYNNTSRVDSFGWRFIQRPSPFLNVKADYLAYKVGDVDDSALLTENIPLVPDDEMVFEDRLLNSGEEYDLTFSLNDTKRFYSADLHFNLDTNVFEFLEVSSPLMSTVGSVSDNVLKVYITSIDLVELKEEETLLNVKFKAKANSTLGESLKLSSTLPSFFVSEEYEKIYVQSEVSNQITSQVADLEFKGRSQVTPNPASNFINIEHNLDGDVNFQFFNAQGVLVMQSKESQIDISQLSRGVYIMNGNDGKSRFSSRFIKL